MIHEGILQWPQKRGTAQLIDRDGVTELKGKDETLNRFVQHFTQLFSVPGIVDQTALDSLPDTFKRQTRGVTKVLKNCWVR